MNILKLTIIYHQLIYKQELDENSMISKTFDFTTEETEDYIPIITLGALYGTLVVLV